MNKRYILISFLVIVLLGLAFYVSQRERQAEKKPLKLKPIAFEQLPGWKESKTLQSFLVFQTSCKSILKQSENAIVGSRHIPMQAKQWQPVCKAALALDELNNKTTKQFFETWFQPLEFYQKQPVAGLFTGYYSPLLHASMKKTETYRWPLYKLPEDLVKVNLSLFSKDWLHKRVSGRVVDHHLKPYHTREEINHGAIEKKAKVIAWLDDPIDRQFLEIQGSGLIELDNGKRFFVGYAGENGQPYTSIAAVLIRKGVMTRDNASMQGIKKYLNAHPEERTSVLHENESFVFFEKQNINEAFGAQGLALTPGYSMAVDRKWIPLGTPLWLDTSYPDQHTNQSLNLNRLMIAQDTGGAIRGPVRGDVYWGAGDEAERIAGHMKNPGHYWLLLPKALFTSMNNSELSGNMIELAE